MNTTNTYTGYILQVQFEVRQAAAIQLKNICRECWAERVNFAGYPLSDAEGTKPPLLDDEEKGRIRPGLVAALLEEPEKRRKRRRNQ